MSEPKPPLPAQPMTKEEFRSWRERCGLSQAEAGRALGVHIQTIKRYERGTLEITPMLSLACLGYAHLLWNEMYSTAFREGAEEARIIKTAKPRRKRA